jgi:hypothetical protein
MRPEEVKKKFRSGVVVSLRKDMVKQLPGCLPFASGSGHLEEQPRWDFPLLESLVFKSAQRVLANASDNVAVLRYL